MHVIEPLKPKEVIYDLIRPNGFFPNNLLYPLLIYKQTLECSNTTSSSIEEFLKKNNWINSWVDGIYDYHHYHSNIHETIVIISGQCHVQIGGVNGKIYPVI